MVTVTRHYPSVWVLSASVFLACSSPVAPDAGVGPLDAGPATTDAGRVAPDAGTGPRAQDIRTTHVVLDLTSRRGHATMSVVPATGAAEVVLEVGLLDVTDARVNGSVVNAAVTDGRLTVPAPAPAQGAAVEVEVTYVFPRRTVATFDGWLPAQGIAFLWPTFCSNLFPCTTTPDDGVTFTMEVTGVPAGQQAIYPATTHSDVPSYVPALAVGSHVSLPLGTTAAGTAVSAWFEPAEVTEATAREGTADLVAVQDHLERWLGAYAFGPELRAVAVDWGDEEYGGFEAHPYYHVPTADFGNPEVHAHEAAHAWFGNGVRLACWEDFVLSEGTTTYLAARAMDQVGGPELWSEYGVELELICATGEGNTVVLQDGTCNTFDFLNEWSLAHYMKGACFYEAVADLMGWDALDAVLRDFYQAHALGAARMEDMLTLLRARVAASDRQALDALEVAWLRTLACPQDAVNSCVQHRR